MSREDPPMRIRLPESLKAQIDNLAKSNRRSMNAEIVARLEQSILAETGLLTGQTVAERLDKLERQVNEIVEMISPSPNAGGKSASEILLAKMKKNLRSD